MKKVFFVCVAMTLVSGADAATCAVTASKHYMSCKPGYYYGSLLEGGEKTCTRCPRFKTGVYGTSVDKNTGDETSCYVPSGTTGSDDTGTFEYTFSCYYTN